MLPALTGKTVTPLLVAPEEPAAVLLATSAAGLLASGVGTTLVSIEGSGLLAIVIADSELLVVSLDVALPAVAFVVATACRE